MSKITHICQCRLIRKGNADIIHELDRFPDAMGYCLDKMRSDRSIAKAEIRMRIDGNLSLQPIWAIRNVHHYTRSQEAEAV